MKHVDTIYRKGWRISEQVQSFISSVSHDTNIVLEVLEVAAAHVIVLNESGSIPRRAACRLAETLLKLLENPKPLIESMKGFEDIHEALERILEENASDAAHWFPLARSRNDHVAAALRLWIRRRLARLLCSLVSLAESLAKKALEYPDMPFPVHTHFQPAQWGTVGHWLLSYAEAILDYLPVLTSIYRVVNKSPLGSGPACGTTIGIEREAYAKYLGFEGVVDNTLYATQSRMFANLALCAIAPLLVELSRLTTDLVLLSHPVLGVLELPEEHVSTSSAMPHKRNAVTAEVFRATAALAVGMCTSALAVNHGLPHGYNLDLQEENRVIYQLDRIVDAVEVLRDCIEKLRVNDVSGRLSNLVLWSFEASEQLSIREGVPFRDAYRLIADAIRRGEHAKVLARLNLYPPNPSKLTSLRVVVGAANPEKVRESATRLLEKLSRFNDECKQLMQLETSILESIQSRLKEVTSTCH